ncbi:AEC family transporter, partial [Leptospira sp. SA-E8]|uniref:AEC family transporter n=1 Tax=Leptospira sp. SA-E8 TaxID=3422259 RepID=UPI003EBDAAD6
MAHNATFGNLVMICIAFVGLAYGEAGLVILLSLVSIHALVLLSIATVALEFAIAHEKTREHADGATGRVGARALLRMVLGAVRNTLIHPVPLPIIAGLLYGQTGWGIPAVIDLPLQWLGAAMGPLALLLVGVSLSGSSIGPHLRGAMGLSMLKLLLLPALVVGMALLCGISGLPLTIMAVAASLPMGANAFLFSQRYEVAQDLVTASIA